MHPSTMITVGTLVKCVSATLVKCMCYYNMVIGLRQKYMGECVSLCPYVHKKTWVNVWHLALTYT